MRNHSDSKIILIIILFLFCFTSCDHNPSETTWGDQEFWPLKTGNTWTYLSYYFSVPDTVVTQVTGTLPLVIKGDTVLASKVALVSVNTTPNPNPYEKLYWNGPAGIYLCGSIAGADTLIAKSLIPEFRFNVAVGDSWTVYRPVYTYPYDLADSVTYTLIAIDEELKTPAGTFKCHVYQYTALPASDISLPNDYQYYFAQGTGLIGTFERHHPSELNGHDNSIISKLLLMSRDLKK